MLNATRLRLALVGALLGALLFWLVQVLAGGGTITAFMGREIVTAGRYPTGLATPIGWAVHLGVSLCYALLMAAVMGIPRQLTPMASVATTLGAALALGWMTTLVAPPAISIAVAVLGERRWPAALFPLNTDLGLPWANHVLFFVVNWLIQAIGPRLLAR